MVVVSTTIRLIAPESLAKANRELSRLSIDGTFEVVIRKYSGGKTLSQLGALFGVWAQFIQDEHGTNKNDWHRQMKASFLAPIYAESPTGPEQESWSELLLLYHETYQSEQFDKHFKRMSLSWARVSQMKKYMDDIQAYYADNGIALPVPDPQGEHKRFARAAA